jgi:hypothetical protein
MADTSPHRFFVDAAAKVEAGAAGASEKPQNDGPGKLAGMFSQKLDEDLNDVHFGFLSLEPKPYE